jgi:hypothetical protein
MKIAEISLNFVILIYFTPQNSIYWLLVFYYKEVRMKKIFGLLMIVGLLAGFESAKADPDTLVSALQKQQLANRCTSEASCAYSVAVAEFKSACRDLVASRAFQVDPAADKTPEPLNCATTPMLKKERQNVIEKYNKLIQSSN